VAIDNRNYVLFIYNAASVAVCAATIRLRLRCNRARNTRTCTRRCRLPAPAQHIGARASIAGFLIAPTARAWFRAAFRCDAKFCR